MNRNNSIQALISKSKKSFISLKTDYDASLQDQIISEELKIDVKNIFENLRSCLDYMAHDIHEACIKGSTANRLYFPIRQTRIEFDQAINKDFQNLSSLHSDVYNLVEEIQPYNDDWLGKFNKLTNNNKHQNLEEQTKTESRYVEVSSPSGERSVSWGPGVSFAGNISVMGAPIDLDTQLPINGSNVNTKITIWVDFKFKENDESILPFIQKSIDKVEALFISLNIHI
ncbi:hypothetical protein NG769_10925 [Aliarcobacter cryaerophilus]|uniref:hypothetical protein n=1 Tax=Aliarcobacter cryaerophilus TaxID=28198 RepID=UPI003DA26029